MKYAWIGSNKKQWPVSMACDMLGVSTRGYFEHMRRKGTDQPSQPGTNKRISNEALWAHIRAIHAEVKQEYGWPKMWKELLARGIRVGKERVRRTMQEHGIKARGKRKFVVTTDSKHNLPIAQGLLQRNFTASAPQSGVDGRHHLYRDERGLVVSGCGAGPIQPPGGGLEHAATHAKLTGNGCAAHGLVPPSTRGRCDLPLRPWQSILRPRIPVSACRIQDEKLNEPQG